MRVFSFVVCMAVSILTACSDSQETAVKEDQPIQISVDQTRAGPSCGGISAVGFPSPKINQAVSFPRSACMTAAECAAGGGVARQKVGAKYCDGSNDAQRNCNPGTGCAINQTCQPEYHDASSGMTVAGCAVAPGACPAGQVNCSCTATIAANKQLLCGCRCDT